MSKLKQIQKFGQQVANAMAAVLEVEVVLIDDKRSIIAGTGYYHERVGSIFGENTISDQVLRAGKTFVIQNARKDTACQGCPQKEACFDKAEICIPIVVQDQIIGVFALVAVKKAQQDRLVNDEKRMLEFVTRISDLIASAIDAKELTDKLSHLSNEFQVVVDSVQEGIIATDSSGQITQINNFAVKLLKNPKTRILNRSILEIFPDPIVKQAIHSGALMSNQEIYATLDGDKIYFLASLTQLHDQKGHVLLIRNISEVGNIVGNYLLKERNFTFQNLIGESASIREIIEKAKLIAESNSTVLVQGESGTGKDLFARAIHNASLRSGGPLIAVNCAAIPEPLLESELFGYEEGAFTGAKRGGKPGRFELANEGTIFLDEMGDLPLHLQAKLLRVLEQKFIDRLGCTRPIPINVRIIAGTNKNLEEMVQRGEFRKDLYYRLNVIPITIPPLRERKEDIILLLDHFRIKFNKLLHKSITGYSEATLSALLSYPWPGNVRELENTIEYAVNIEQGETIQVSSIPLRLLEAINGEDRMKMDKELMTLPEMEKGLIEKALMLYGSSSSGKEAAAKALNIGIATLYRKIKLYGILNEPNE